MMRRTHSINVRLCMPTRESSRINAGRPMMRANRRATLKYWPYSSSTSCWYLCSAAALPVLSASPITSAAMRAVSYA